MKDNNKDIKGKDENGQKAAPDMESLQAELKVLREELAAKDNYYDKCLRLQAEFDNFRKRVAKERVEFIKFANEALILELVQLLDDFERGIKSADQKKDFGLLHQGVDMISKQLHRLLEEKGLKRVKSVGETFNPHEHEALEVVEDKTKQDGLILEELQPGYKLNDRVIRPAKVKVVKNKEEKDG
jgi:molecular chaperone GrpE